MILFLEIALGTILFVMGFFALVKWIASWGR